eukprot:GHUV01034646.1.p1 GENE.GHUV01034646.1~~GHUV01034646.1.p1  ORF type:complete len:134 (-),score=5.77 GHUV01034646.1:41-442(-)
MFSEAYIIFSLGLTRPLQTALYPECFKTHEACPETVTHVQNYIQICGKLLQLAAPLEPVMHVLCSVACTTVQTAWWCMPSPWHINQGLHDLTLSCKCLHSSPTVYLCCAVAHRYHCWYASARIPWRCDWSSLG